MIEIVINLGDENMKNQVEVSFFVEEPPKISSDWSKTFAKWRPTCGDQTELYHLQCEHRQLGNPVAFFRDVGESLPFLILYEFDTSTTLADF